MPDYGLGVWLAAIFTAALVAAAAGERKRGFDPHDRRRAFDIAAALIAGLLAFGGCLLAAGAALA